MEHLYDTRIKKGDDFIERLLNNQVVVNIKIDQAALVLKKVNGIVTFYGREGRGEINKVKRVMMDTYEGAIHHLQDQAKSLPDGVEVYLELFHDKWQTKVKYTTKPKNDLIISYIKRNGVTLLPTNPYNNEVATLLDVAPPPVLFSGQLSEYQRNSIKQFVRSTTDERREKYGGVKFIEFVESIFDTPQELKWLHVGGYEGIVFYFNGGQFSAKLVDPLFTADKQEESNGDIGAFRKTLLELMYEYLKNDLSVVANQFVVPVDSASIEDTFVSFISVLTCYIVEHHQDQLSVLEAYEHDQKQKRFSNLTYDLLPTYMEQLTKKFWWTEELFAILANTLQKEKVMINTKQGLTQERKEAVNSMIAMLRARGLVQ